MRILAHDKRDKFVYLSPAGFIAIEGQTSSVAEEALQEAKTYMRKKSKVLLIAPQPFFESRGTPMNVRAMVETLAKSGSYEVDLLVFPFGEEFHCDGVSLERCVQVPGVRSVPVGPSFQKLFLDGALFYSASRLSKMRQYDFFHGVEEGAFIAGHFARKHRKPFICDMDSCMHTQLRESSVFGTNLAAYFFSYLERRALKNASAVLTVCTALSAKVKSIAPEAPLFQIEDFPAEGSESGDATTIARLRSEFKLPTDVRHIVYTGNFERYQGIDLLLESFAQLRNREKIRLVLVGGGGPGAPHFERYQRLAEKLDVDEHCIFCGNRPQDEMGSFMALADVLVSPRIEGENTPLKLYSYMASGKPIVATDIYSHTQVLTADTAYLASVVPSEFALALQDATSVAPEAQASQQRRATAASTLVEKQFSRAAFERRLLALYRSLDVSSSSVSQASSAPPLEKVPSSSM